MPTLAHQNHEDVVTAAFDGLTAEMNGSGGRKLRTTYRTVTEQKETATTTQHKLKATRSVIDRYFGRKEVRR